MVPFKAKSRFSFLFILLILLAEPGAICNGYFNNEQPDGNPVDPVGIDNSKDLNENSHKTDLASSAEKPLKSYLYISEIEDPSHGTKARGIVKLDEHRVSHEIYFYQKGVPELFEHYIVNEKYEYEFDGNNKYYDRTTLDEESGDYYYQARKSMLWAPVWSVFKKDILKEQNKTENQGKAEVNGINCDRYRVELLWRHLFTYVYVDGRGLIRRVEHHDQEEGGDISCINFTRIEINPTFSSNDFKPYRQYPVHKG